MNPLIRFEGIDSIEERERRVNVNSLGHVRNYHILGLSLIEKIVLIFKWDRWRRSSASMFAFVCVCCQR